MAITYHSNPRGTPGQLVYLTGASGNRAALNLPDIVCGVNEINPPEA